MINMILPVERGDVGSSQGTTALVAEEVEAAEVVGLAEGIRTLSIFALGGEELGGNDLAAILRGGRELLATSERE